MTVNSGDNHAEPLISLGTDAQTQNSRFEATPRGDHGDDAFEQELRAAPWGYGQNQQQQVQFALAEIRQRGLWEQAAVLEREIKTLQTELSYLRR